MRRFVLSLALVAAMALPVAAQAADDGGEQPKPYDQLNQRERERELQAQRWQGPSGFWTSPHKSEHGAYRYRMMGIGAVLLLGTGWLMVRLVRRANDERGKRP